MQSHALSESIEKSEKEEKENMFTFKRSVDQSQQETPAFYCEEASLSHCDENLETLSEDEKNQLRLQTKMYFYQLIS